VTLRVSAAYAAMVLTWGSTWAAIRIGVAEVPPFIFAFERAIAVAVLLTIVSLALRLPFPRGRRTIAAVAAAGIINTGVSWALIFWAEQYVPSGLVAVFGATFPVWTAFLAHFLVRGDRLSAAKLIALGLGLAGTAALVGAPASSGGPEALAAMLLLVLMPVGWAVAAIIASRALATLSPLPTIAVEVWAGAAVLALSEAGRPSHWTPGAAIAMAYLVLFGSCLGLVLNLWLYRKLRPTTVSLAQVLIPAQALLIGALALGEELTARMLVGAVLVAAAVALNAYAGAGTRRPEAEGVVATAAD